MTLLARSLLLAAIAASSLPAAAAPREPQGRYVLDVQTSYRNLESAGAASPETRKMLEQAKGLMTIQFQGPKVSFVTGPALGNVISGTCDWSLVAPEVRLERCQAGSPDSGAFAIGGRMEFDERDGSITIKGDGAPAAVVYRVE